MRAGCGLRGCGRRGSRARWSGIALGLIELINIPLGTIIGIVVLVYLNRATKAGLFAKPAGGTPPPAPPQPS